MTKSTVTLTKFALEVTKKVEKFEMLTVTTLLSSLRSPTYFIQFNQLRHDLSK